MIGMVVAIMGFITFFASLFMIIYSINKASRDM